MDASADTLATAAATELFSPDIAEKLFLLLAGVFIAQAVSFFNSYMQKRKLINSHFEELEQISEEVDRLILGFKRRLQIASLKGVDYSYCIPVKALIHESYYKEIVTSLSKTQRISFQLIHGHLEALNIHIEACKNHTIAMSDIKPLREQDCVRWAEDSVSGFTASKVLQWHIRHHIKNRKNPTLIFGDADHQHYTKFFQDALDEANDLKNNPSADLSPEDFEKVYNPNSFGSEFQNIHAERI